MNSEVQTVPDNSAQMSPDPTQSYVLPPVDIAETEAGFVLFADLPGVSKDRLAVRVDGDNLVIEGAVDAPSPENMQILYGEAQFSAYRRQFTLSRELDRSKIQANLNDGVLKLTIPKTEEAKPRRIEVKLG